MKKMNSYHWLIWIIAIAGILFIFGQTIGHEVDLVSAQIPTISIPTVTSSPAGPMVTVRAGSTEPYVNVRAYPSTLAPAVGILSQGQDAPAIGITPGNDWVLIQYPGAPGGIGWVFAANVSLSAQVPVVTPQPTPAPQITSTIDPTLAAQFNDPMQPTRMPTFTPPPPLVIPTYSAVGETGGIGGVPAGLFIAVFFVLGILVGFIYLLQNR